MKQDKIRINLPLPRGVQVYRKDRTILIYKELDADKEAEKFVRRLQRICKDNNWRNRLITHSTKAQVLGLRRIYNLSDPHLN